MGGNPPKPGLYCPEPVCSAYPNRPLSSGIRVVPIRATPPPAMSCFMPCDFEPDSAPIPELTDREIRKISPEIVNIHITGRALFLSGPASSMLYFSGGAV